MIGFSLMSTGPDSSSRHFDAGLLEAVNRFAQRTTWLHGPAKAYASYGVVLFAVLLLAGWWVARGSSERVAAAVWAGAAGLVAVGLNQILVAQFAESRPYAVDSSLLVLADRSSDPAFPSDHATLVGAVAVGLWFADRRVAVVAGFAALVMAFARVYTAAHYPHDVVAGLAFGAFVAIVGWFALRRPLVAIADGLAETPLRPLFTPRNTQSRRASD